MSLLIVFEVSKLNSYSTLHMQLMVLEAFEEWVAGFESQAAGRRRSAAKLIRDWAGEDAAAASLVQVEAGLAAVGLARRGARALFECALGAPAALARIRASYHQASPQPKNGQEAEVESELEWLLAGAEVDAEEVAAALADTGGMHLPLFCTKIQTIVFVISREGKAPKSQCMLLFNVLPLI